MPDPRGITTPKAGTTAEDSAPSGERSRLVTRILQIRRGGYRKSEVLVRQMSEVRSDCQRIAVPTRACARATTPQNSIAILSVDKREAIIQFSSTRRGRESSRTDWVAVGANRFNGFAPAPSVHLFQDSMDVIPHRKLRKIQVGSDFLVCKSFGDEVDQLLLT